MATTKNDFERLSKIWTKGKHPKSKEILWAAFRDDAEAFEYAKSLRIKHPDWSVLVAYAN